MKKLTELEIGMDTEQDHTLDKDTMCSQDTDLARVIAQQHLKDDSKYYSKLKASGLDDMPTVADFWYFIGENSSFLSHLVRRARSPYNLDYSWQPLLNKREASQQSKRCWTPPKSSLRAETPGRSLLRTSSSCLGHRSVPFMPDSEMWKGYLRRCETATARRSIRQQFSKGTKKLFNKQT